MEPGKGPMGIDSSTERKIQALLQLLNDPNHQVAKTIHRELVGMGEVILPFLENPDQDNQEMGSRLADIREDIRFGKIRQELERLRSVSNDHLDLEAGAFLLARSAYPDLDVSYYSQRLDELAHEVRPRISPSHTPEQASQILCDYLFREKGFRGNREHYYDPDNSFLNRVLERRTGIPISLSVLFLFLARRLSVPCVGVGMPGHFVVKVVDIDPEIFIDCFNGGMFLQAKDCEQFLTEAGVGFDPSYLLDTPNDLILARMIRNLIGIYQKQEDDGQVSRLNFLIAALEYVPGDD